jgi:multiple sugar transport system permease protein
VAAIGIIAFLWAWAQFMWPYLILNSDALQPITVGIFYFLGDENIIWNALAAGEVLAMAPGLAFFIIAQKHIVRGLSGGAIKG